MTIKSRLKYTCQTRKANILFQSRALEGGTRLLRAGAVFLGVPTAVSGLVALTIWQRRSLLPDASAILVLFTPPCRREPGPCPPPAAGGLCSLAPVPGGRLPGRRQPQYHPPGLREGGVCAAWRGTPGPVLVERGRVRGGPCSLKPEPPTHPPGESQES